MVVNQPSAEDADRGATDDAGHVKAARDLRERQRKECDDDKRDEDDGEAEAAGADS